MSGSGSEYLKSNESYFKGINDKLTKFGGLVSGGILPSGKGIGSFFGVFVGKVSESDQKGLRESLEKFVKALEVTTHALEEYNDEQRKQSQLPVNVKTSLVAVYEWSQILDSGRQPPDLLSSIKTKAESLEQAVANETLRFGVKIEQKLGQVSTQVDYVAFIAGINVKKPLEYYSDGKVLISQKKWNEAKDAFLAYQKFANLGQTGQLRSEDKIRDPHEDKHLEYLEYIEKNLQKILPQDDEQAMLFSALPKVPQNPYTDPRTEWRKKYPYRGGDK